MDYQAKTELGAPKTGALSSAPDCDCRGHKKNQKEIQKEQRHERTNAGAPNEPTSGIARNRRDPGTQGDGTESEAFIYDLISCTFDITIAVNASSF